VEGLQVPGSNREHWPARRSIFRPPSFSASRRSRPAGPREPVRRGRLSRQTAERTARRILSGRVPPGGKPPPERDVGGRPSVARTSLRESLRRMEAMGRNQIRAGDGGGRDAPAPSASPTGAPRPREEVP